MTAQPKAPPAKSGNRSFVMILVILLVLGLGAIGVVVFRSSAAPKVTIVPPDAQLPDAKGYVIGSEKAPVEVVMYGDFECPGCGKFATITEPDVDSRLVKTGLIRFRFMDFPLQHPSTRFAHNAAACAGAQDKFWQMHDRIYNGQPEWSELANGRDMDAPKVMKRYAKELGLDTKAFNACLDSRQFEPQIHANYNQGIAIGVNGTPSFKVGNRLVWAVLSYDALKALVDSATADAKKGDSAKKKS